VAEVGFVELGRREQRDAEFLRCNRQGRPMRTESRAGRRGDQEKEKPNQARHRSLPRWSMTRRPSEQRPVGLPK
jgi:hypothetical protein